MQCDLSLVADVLWNGQGCTSLPGHRWGEHRPGAGIVFLRDTVSAPAMHAHASAPLGGALSLHYLRTTSPPPSNRKQYIFALSSRDRVLFPPEGSFYTRRLISSESSCTEGSFLFLFSPKGSFFRAEGSFLGFNRKAHTVGSFLATRRLILICSPEGSFSYTRRLISLESSYTKELSLRYDKIEPWGKNRRYRIGKYSVFFYMGYMITELSISVPTAHTRRLICLYIPEGSTAYTRRLSFYRKPPTPPSGNLGNPPLGCLPHPWCPANSFAEEDPRHDNWRNVTENISDFFTKALVPREGSLLGTSTSRHELGCTLARKSRTDGGGLRW